MENILRTLIYLSAGLFMGWSLGANDAANIFGTAVTTRMVKFKTAAIIMGIMIALGAVVSGAGPVETLGALGEIVELEEAFAVSLTAALSVLLMTRKGLPVSTSQAIVGAILGWNLQKGDNIQFDILFKIAGTWIFAPILGAMFAMVFYVILKALRKHTQVNILKEDRFLRIALLVAGAFGSYSLGANNMANVIGVFTNSVYTDDITMMGWRILSGQQLLYLVGAAAVTVGVFMYSRKVMETVGNDIVRLTPSAALVVVLASATVLFIFASQNLKSVLDTAGLPSFPLVPVSQSQTVVGAVIGIGIIKGGRNLNFRKLAVIAGGWVTTPLLAMVLSFFLLSFY